jgi:hypothetical protein
VTRDDDFLARWSRRKHAVRRGEAVDDPATAPPAAAPAASAAPAAVSNPPVAVPGAGPPEVELPPVESLTPDSDFQPFMRDGVDPLLRRQALKTLFRDPRFNVMDGLDVYIDDYAKPDPIPPDWLEKLNQMARLGDYKPPEPESEKVAEGRDEAAQPSSVAENQALEEDPHPEGPGSDLDSPPTRN